MLKYPSDILQNEKVKCTKVGKLEVMAAFYISQGKSGGKSMSESRFDGVVFYERLMWNWENVSGS